MPKKKTFDEIKGIGKKFIIQSLPVCIQTERSLVLIGLEDLEILLEAFILMIFH